ncbi:MAG: hypothetical protein ACJ780_19365 [Solirubrobacteraceae bacterium]
MSARAHLSRRRAVVALAATAIAAGGTAACGPPPPQAPVAAASSISTALQTIASACGQSYRRHAFDPHGDVSTLEKMASSSAATLGRLSHKHPEWIYQSKTLLQLDGMSAEDLRECGLSRSADVLWRSSR